MRAAECLLFSYSVGEMLLRRLIDLTMGVSHPHQASAFVSRGQTGYSCTVFLYRRVRPEIALFAGKYERLSKLYICTPMPVQTVMELSLVRSTKQRFYRFFPLSWQKLNIVILECFP